MGYLKKLLKAVTPNPFFQLLKTAKVENKSRFLILWNRGLGDIPLGLYALVSKIKEQLPKAEITFVTRQDLAEGFKLLDGVHTYVHPNLKRSTAKSLGKLMEDLGLFPSDYDYMIEKIDADRWLSWQIGEITPKLSWDNAYDLLSEKFGLKGQNYIGVHVSSETDKFYGYDKNWPKGHFEKLFQEIKIYKDYKILLFGFEKNETFPGDHIIDLRGQTKLLEVLSLMKNQCSHFIAPDSGLLSFSYYINTAFPIKMVSLWSDPKQGVLRQKVASPNPLYKHTPLVGLKGDVKNISVQEVLKALSLKSSS